MDIDTFTRAAADVAAAIAARADDALDVLRQEGERLVASATHRIGARATWRPRIGVGLALMAAAALILGLAVRRRRRSLPQDGAAAADVSPAAARAAVAAAS